MAIDNRTDSRGWPLPAPGNKLRDDVLRLIAAFVAADADVAALISDVAGKANADHPHTMAAITGLAAALAGKMDTGFHDSLDGLTDVSVAGASVGQVLMRQAMAWIPVALQVNHVANLESLLNGKATPADLAALKNEILGGAGAAFDTLGELAAMLGNDPNFATTMANALAKRLRVDAATAFTEPEKVQGRSNLGAASATDMAGALRKDIVQALTAAEIVRMLGNTKQVWEHISTTDVSVAVPYVDLTSLGAYRDLRLKVTFAQTEAANLSMRYGSGGTPSITANYVLQTFYGAGTSPTANENVGDTAARVTFGGGVADPANWNEAQVFISDFNKARSTRSNSAAGQTSSTGRAVGTFYVAHTVQTAWDFIRLFPSSGNVGVGSRFILEGVRG